MNKANYLRKLLEPLAVRMYRNCYHYTEKTAFKIVEAVFETQPILHLESGAQYLFETLEDMYVWLQNSISADEATYVGYWLFYNKVLTSTIRYDVNTDFSIYQATPPQTKNTMPKKQAKDDKQTVKRNPNPKKQDKKKEPVKSESAAIEQMITKSTALKLFKCSKASLHRLTEKEENRVKGLVKKENGIWLFTMSLLKAHYEYQHAVEDLTPEDDTTGEMCEVVKDNAMTAVKKMLDENAEAIKRTTEAIHEVTPQSEIVLTELKEVMNTLVEKEEQATTDIFNNENDLSEIKNDLMFWLRRSKEGNAISAEEQARFSMFIQTTRQFYAYLKTEKK